MTEMRVREMGKPIARVDGPAKVHGTATYAFEYQVDRPLYLHPVQSTIARGRVTDIDSSAAHAVPGVVLVLTPDNAPRLADQSDGELSILQDRDVHFRGQILGGVLAVTSEAARQGAGLVRFSYEEEPHDVQLDPESDALYKPDQVNPSFETDTQVGDVEAALAGADVTLDETYSTPTEFNNPMEPHATVAQWDGTTLTLYDSTQGAHTVRTKLAPVFGLEPDHVRVVAKHVGGGFGSKGMPHAHNVLAGLAAMKVHDVPGYAGRPVKLALTRQQMFSLVGYRTPTIQRVRLGADREGHLAAITHDVVEQTSRVKEFAEQTAVVTRMMYAAPARSTSHRLAALDVSVPSWMRAPGECPGMFAPEVALDELAVRLGIDPVELRIRNEPERDPETGKPWSSRNLVACLRQGAERFGWNRRDPTPGVRRENRWLIGSGVASSVYPVHRRPGSQATIRLLDNGCYRVEIGATDIGTGTWTSLCQIAADALEVSFDDVDLQIGDTDLPFATVAGGSAGMIDWGSTVTAAAQAFREQHGRNPSPGAQASGEMPGDESADYAKYAFGAHFAEVRVDADTGEVRVPRMVGVFAAGRIINAHTGRSQFLGAMTMGIGMALHEQGVTDPRFGHVVNHDLAEYHVPASADVDDLDVTWLEEDDPYVNQMGAKGIGEIGIVGAAAAIANGAFHATGIRVRDLPLTPDKFLPR